MLALLPRFRQHVAQRFQRVGRRAPLVLVAVAMSAGTMRAQSKVAGRWLVVYEHETRSGHVSAPRVAADTAHMTLRQVGDSVLGEWQAAVRAGEPAAHPRELRGTIRRDTVRLHLASSAQENESFFAELGREIVEFLKTHVHGMPPLSSLVEFTVRDDALAGVRWSASADGSVETPRRSFWASRERP